MSGATSHRLEDLHELISFEDPEENRTWMFDATYLESNWTCIFGAGCKGVHEEDVSELVQGCCSHGAHLTDKDDRRKLRQHADRLRADQWQFAAVAARKGITKKNDDGVHVTRRVDGACIFLNRPDHPNGPGCALHQAALDAGERPLDWKPEVCWQLPLRRIDETDSYGHVTSTIREWKRRDWGEGGAAFHWWCTEADDAFVGKRAVWQSMADELTEMTSPAAYELLTAVMKQRAKDRSRRRTETAVAIRHKPR